MGILTRGQYTHGTQTWATIITLSGSRQINIGDTVFDSTYNKKRTWDGFNFVHSHQASVFASGSNMSYGSALTVAANQDDAVRYSVSATDLEGVIGICEDQKSAANGDYVTVHYHGQTKALIEAAAGGGNVEPGDLLDFGGVQKYSTNAGGGAVGVYGVYIDATVTTNSSTTDITTLRDIVFAPVERN